MNNYIGFILVKIELLEFYTFAFSIYKLLIRQHNNINIIHICIHNLQIIL